MFYSCKDKTTEPVLSTHDYIGWVIISDSTCDPIKNYSGVKVTVIQTGAVSYSDSAGHYKFTNLSTGNYDFLYEYKDYPQFYLQNIALSGINGSVIKAKDLDEISPKATHTFILDSAVYGSAYSTNSSQTDTTLNLYSRRFNSFPIRYSNHIDIISKSQSNLDYLSGKYDKILGWSSSSLAYKTTDSLWETFSYDSLKHWGFKSGDSICIKYYAVNSISYYIDKTTGKRIYPYIGSESNVYATKLK
ncbi:MAG: carboxypeptidase regulatory-like domain-containing protein [Ignavibacteria bacterium]|nr:carboxypeptidase regulatory-like domain-containing protein [Ignavibacteria bacterium]